ncbi:hypothetical protein TNCV_607211 [Trichonephila clavipes]|nr:hypothetical protein TNCV_607211 [Trichonephila clavipes]
MDCSIVLSEKFVVVDDGTVCAAPIMTDKDILDLVQSSKNIIDADFYDENEMNNVAPVSTRSEMKNVMKTELAERWTALPQVSDESRSFFRVHTGYFSNITKCIKAEFIASWACSQSSVVSSSQR